MNLSGRVAKAERAQDEIPFVGIFVPWRSISSVAVHA